MHRLAAWMTHKVEERPVVQTSRFHDKRVTLPMSC
jgi:hypothetical protein